MALTSTFSGLLRPLRVGMTSLLNAILLLHLFTRSDIIATLVPVTLFGTAAAPADATHHILPRILWTWFLILQENVANQSLQPEEDTINKPWRPIPSKRISLRSARVLRWALLPASILLSMALRVPAAGTALSITIYLYNDLDWASHWLTKSLCNAVGYACFNAGASMVSSTSELSKTSLHAQILIALVILSTVHAQDFRDTEGDSRTGRCTLATAYPFASRLSMMFVLPGWSLFLSYFWAVDAVFAVPFVLLGTFVGVRFFLNGNRANSPSSPRASRDHSTYQIYNVWLWCVHIVPFLPRLAY